MAMRTRLTGVESRVWCILAMVVLIGAALAVSTDHSQAQPPVDAVTTDTTITLSWTADGEVHFFWFQRETRQVQVISVTDGKSYTIADLKPKSEHAFSFFGAFFGTLDVTTKADNDPPPPPPPPTPEVSIAAGADITEGSQATFALTASPAPTQSISVSVSPSQSGAFGVGSTAKTVTIGTSGTATVSFSTTSDSVDEVDGSVTATVDSGSGYTVSSSKGSATLAVADDDVPELSIASDGNVTEGSAASFTISASPTPHTALTANVDITASGSFGVTTGARTVTIPTSGSQSYTVSTSGDTTDEPHGSVTASLSTGTGYTVSSSAGSASATVSDDDDPPPAKPVVRITPGSDITEGEGAYFTVTIAPRQIGGQSVGLVVTESGAFVSQSALQHILIMEERITFSVSTGDDSTDEPDGTITATIRDHEQYTVAPTAGSATLTVADNDVPELSITSDGNVTEGSAASFTITASPTPHAALTANVFIAASGSFGVTTGTRTVTIPTSGSQSFTVSTSGDSTDEPHGSVTATLSSGTGYTVSSSAGSASATVSDDDDPPKPAKQQTAQEVIDNCVTDSLLSKVRDYYDANKHRSPGYGANWKRVLIAFGDATDSELTAFTASEAQERESKWFGWKPVREALDCIEAAAQQQPPPPPPADPEISIASSSDITEGGTVTFTLTATPAPTSDVSVSVAVTQSGSFTSQAGARTVTITGGGTGTASFAIATDDDATDEANGSLTATVNTGTGYTVSSSAGATTANVSDNDVPPLPVISVTSGSDVTEGGTVTFTLTATPAPTSNINVSVAVTESESYTQHGQTGTRTVTITSTGTASLAVTTIDDSSDDFAGTVTATVNTGTGYTVSSTAGSTYVNVYDNDDPTVFISPGKAITEGMDAVFKFQVSATQTRTIRVRLTVSQSGEFATTGPRTITITTSGTYVLRVPTTDDSTEESAGSVKVTINSGDGYTGSGSATVKVADNDKPLMGRALASSKCVSVSLKEQVRDYHYDNRKKPPDHGLNWWRVRTAFADAPGSKYPPYTAAEASASEATWSGWTPVRVALECIETAMLNGPAAVPVFSDVYQFIPGAGLIDPPGRRNQLFRAHDPDTRVKSYKIKLRQQPPQDVTVRPTFGEGEGRRWFKQALVIEPETLTFTTSNWKDFQTFTVTAKPDFNLSDEQFDLKLLIDELSDATIVQTRWFFINWDGRNDLVTYDPRGTSFKLFEGGEALEYNIKLGGVPDSPAVLTFTSALSGALTVSPSKLTFDLDNWDEWQTVTITAVHDPNARHENASIIVRTRMPGYKSLYTPNNPRYRYYTSRIYVKTLDDELADVLLDKTVVKLIEGKTTGTYTVRLNTDPGMGNTVTVTPVSGDPSRVTVSGALTFDTDNWTQEQTVTVTSLQDGDYENNDVAITHTIGNYGSATASDVTVKVTDDDHAAEVEVSLERFAMNEGDVKSYAVWIKSDPGDGNTVTVTPKIHNNDRELGISPKKLTFTGGDSGNWPEKQKFVVDAGHFVEPKGKVFTITHAVSGNGVGYPSNMTVPDVLVGVADAWWKVTIEFDRNHNLELTEGDTNGVDIGVKLSNDPGAAGWDENNGDSAEGTVTLQTHPMGDCLVADPPTLTFTTGPNGNWRDYQTLTVKPKSDCVDDGDVVDNVHWVKVSLGMAPYELKFLPGYRSTTKDVVTRSIDITYKDDD